MLFLRPDQISLDKRQRTTIDKGPLDELENSIDAHGIIHAPSVRRVDGVFILASGERRLRACANLLELGKSIRFGDMLCPEGTVPILDLGTRSDIEVFEVELDENIKRENLSWQDRARAEAQLLELRSLQNAQANLPAPTISAIANEILHRRSPDAAPAVGDQVTAVANRIRLADHLADPDVAKAKTEAEAVKIVRKKEEQRRVQALAATFDAATAECPHKLVLGDFRESIKALKDHSIDVLLTDPPYGIDADSFGEQSGQGHAYEDSRDYFNELIAVLSEESYRVCKPEAHAYVFCDPRRFDDLKTYFELAGWAVWPIPLIWNKGNGMLPRPQHAPRRVYECILFATKGNRIVRAVKPDVISIPGVRNLQHGAQKPVELYIDLLARSVLPGDAVLDTFAGSGTIFPAATACKVTATGFELSEEYGALARVRMMGQEASESADPTGLEELEV